MWACEGRPTGHQKSTQGNSGLREEVTDGRRERAVMVVEMMKGEVVIEGRLMRVERERKRYGGKEIGK